MTTAQKSGPNPIAIAAAIAAVSVLFFAWLWWRDLGNRSQIPSALLDRLTASATMIEREIVVELERWEEMAAGPEDVGGLPTGGSRLVFNKLGVIRAAGAHLTFYPAVVPPQVPPDDRLVRARAMEDTGHPVEAIALYREAATSTGRTVRATATWRLASLLEKLGQHAEALSAYAELTTMAEAMVEGSPAPLLGRRGRELVLRAMGDPASADRERALLAEDLIGRSWLIEKSVFDRFSSGIDPGRYPASAVHRSACVAAMWPAMQGAPSGRAIARDGDEAFASIWRTSGGDSRAVIAPVDVLMKQARIAAGRLSVEIALEDAAKNHLWGPRSTSAEVATHSLNRIGLPANLRIWLKGP